MGWSVEMPVILRDLLLDYTVPQLYTDAQLTTTIVISAYRLTSEVSFWPGVTVSVGDLMICPDPMCAETKDVPFVNLVCLKAALTIITGEIRGLVRQSIAIQDGTSRIDLKRDPRSLVAMAKVYQNMYDDALYSYKTGDGELLGQAVVSPYPYLMDWPVGINGGLFSGYPGGRFYRDFSY